jgi:hypothetical protein
MNPICRKRKPGAATRAPSSLTADLHLFAGNMLVLDFGMELMRRISLKRARPRGWARWTVRQTLIYIALIAFGAMKPARLRPEAVTSMTSNLGASDPDPNEVAALFPNPHILPLGAQLA